MAIALRGNGLVRGRAEYLNDGRVMVPVAIRPDVTPEELAAALKATQPELPYDTLSAIGSSPTRFEDGRVLLEFTFEQGTTALSFQHTLNDTGFSKGRGRLTSHLRARQG